MKSNNHIVPGILFRLCTMAAMLLLCIFSFAQEPPVGGPPPPDPGENPEVPIGGIELLLLGGAAYGAKKAYDVYRKRRQ